MADYYLKNSTGETKEISDLGIVIANGQSITISKDDFDGYLTTDMIVSLSDDASLGLILSTSDIGDTSGDLPKAIAIERLSLSHKWKPAAVDFASLPVVGNEDNDIRLVSSSGVLYRWNQTSASWEKITSNFSLTVTDYDESPSGSDINKIVFVQAEDSVYVDGKVAYIGPPAAPISLQGQALSISGTTFYTGKLSDNNNNYKSGEGVSSTVAYIINDGVFELSTASLNCNYGDQGVLAVYLNGTKLAAIDFAANFIESYRESNQLMSTYNNTGNGTPVTAGVAAFTGGKGSLTLLSCGIFNNFKYYQKWSAKISITDGTLLRQGYNFITLVHELDSGDQTTSIDIFYDTDVGSNPSSSIPTVSVVTPALKYLSGVSSYSTGSTFNVSATISDAFDNVYHSSEAPVLISGWPGLSSTSIRYDNATVSGVSYPPAVGDTMQITNYTITQAANQASSNATTSIVVRDPYGSYGPAVSASNNIMIYSYSNSSTALAEYFRDEVYRLPVEAYDTIPSTYTGKWDSTANISSYDDGTGLQVFQGQLIFPVANYSTNLPSGNPNYSSLSSTSNRTYIRAFYDADSHSSGTLRLTGITKAQMFAGSVKVYIKAPTQTGWLSLNKDYNFATFTGADEDGCWTGRDVQSNSDFSFTLGSFYTQNAGNLIIVKIIYTTSSSPAVSFMSVIDW